MKTRIAMFMAVILIATSLTACGGKKEVEKAVNVGEEELKIAFLVERLGDNSYNDECYRGILEFTGRTGVEVLVIEGPELQDHEMNARAFAQEGYDLIVDAAAITSEMYTTLAPEFPDTHFIIAGGTVEDIDNVTCLRDTPNEAAFLVGAFNVLMNQELGGEAKAAFVGGIRNPDLERSQFGFTAGAEYVGGKPTVVYVGNFSDVAKGKEIALQLYNNGMKLVQAFAGGAGMGVFQAAESLGEGYFALGAAAGQFDLSDAIIASQVKLTGTLIYDACIDFYNGTLENGILNKGIKEGAVGIKYSPENESKIPQTIKDEIQELQDKIINGEIVPPATEEEYIGFAK